MFKHLKHLLASLLLALISVPVLANDCSEQFTGGTRPVITDTALKSRATFLCYEEFAVLYSGVKRTPIYAAEYLTKNRIDEGARLKRFDSFHEEDALPFSDRSLLSDYRGSGYDRGHNAPNKDFSTYSAARESFSLANIMPQNSDNNQYLFEGIESATRSLVRQRGRLYVLTGPIGNAGSLKGRVTIPRMIFKAIYDPVRKEAGAYIVNNAEGMDYKTLSVAELENIVGVNLFPDLPSSIKSKIMNLPVPTPHGNRQQGHKKFRF